MIIKHFSAVFLLYCLCLLSFPSMGQNSTEAPSSIGPASSLNIDTSPIGTKADNEQKFLTKYELYNSILNLLPPGWQLSERESNMVIAHENVTIQKQPLNSTPSDPVLEEQEATLKYGKRTYELIIRFEACPRAQYVGAKDRFSGINSQLEQLEDKYDVKEMKLDDGTGWFIAKNKDEKNKLVFFHIEKANLEEQLKPVPELYVENYAVYIDKPIYYKLFPSKVEVQLNSIIMQIQTLLKS